METARKTADKPRDESAIDVTNTGTQVIEETPEEIVLENEEEWAKSVKNLIEQSAHK